MAHLLLFVDSLADSSSRGPGRTLAPRSERWWSMAEPPPGLFPDGIHDLLRLLAVLAIAGAVAAACSVLNRRPAPSAAPSTPIPPMTGRCVDGDLRTSRAPALVIPLRSSVPVCQPSSATNKESKSLGTAEMVTNMILGNPGRVDLTPFSIENRFSGVKYFGFSTKDEAIGFSASA